MSVSVSGIHVTGFVPPLTSLTYTVKYYWFGTETTYTSRGNNGGKNGLSIDYNIRVGNAEDVEKGAQLVSQNETPYSPILVSLQSNPPDIFTGITENPGGYISGEYPDIVPTEVSASYDPSLWVRETELDDWSGTWTIVDDNQGAFAVESSTDSHGGHYTAGFRKARSTLNLLREGEGSISRSQDNPIEVGSSVTISAIPAHGWHFDHWELYNSDDVDYYGIDGSNQSSITVVGIGRQSSSGKYHEVSCGYTAVFKRNYYPVRITSNIQDNRLSFSAEAQDPDTYTTTNINFPVNGDFKYGTIISVYVSVSNRRFWCDYDILWSDGDTSQNLKRLTVNGEISLAANFTRKEYSVEIYCNNGDHGYYTINGSGHYTDNQTVTAHYGDTISIVGYPDDGWKVLYYNQSTTVDCYGGSALSLSFYRDTHVVHISSHKGEGCVATLPLSPECWTSHDAYVQHGSSLYLEARAACCYKFLRWVGISPYDESQNPITIAVNSDMNIAAEFQKCPPDGRIIYGDCDGKIMCDSNGDILYLECDCS